MKKALITGITGQDGSYLAEFLLRKGYEVHGIVRRSSVSTTARIDHIIDRLIIHEGDLSDASSLARLFLRYSRTKRITWPRRAMSRFRLMRRSIRAILTPWAYSAF